MKLSSLALPLLAGSFCFFSASGHIADHTPFHLYDEDGDDLGEFRLMGGDINSWIIDEDGYTVCHKDGAGRSGAHHSRHLSSAHAKKMRSLSKERSHHERSGVKTEEVRANHGEERGYNKAGDLVYYYCAKHHAGNITADLDLPVATTDPTEIEYLEPGIHKSLHVAAAEAGAYGECSLYTGGVCPCDDTKDRRLRGRELTGITQGTVKNLVIPIRFAGHESRTLPSKSDLNILMNAMSPDANLAPTGGVKKVFHDNSGGKLQLESTVLDWVQLSGSTNGNSHTETYCTGAHIAGTKAQGDEHLHDCLVEALNKIDGSVDFKQFDSDGNNMIDAITFIHSSYCSTACGGARDKVWSHMWALNSKRWTSAEGVEVNAYHINPGLIGCSGSKIGTVATIAHETGHFFGLPDLYDRNQGGNGVGSWSLMASSDGFHSSKTYPPMLDPWSKEKLGWGTFTELTSSQNKVVLQPSATTHKYYKISQGFASGEYLLIENRQKKLFDSYIPDPGLLIWHIDNNKIGKQNDEEGYPGQSGWPGNDKHYMVALMQADGHYKFEKQRSGNGDTGDLYGQCLGAGTFGPSTTPNSKGYQGGHIRDTGVTITNIYQQGDDMVFDVCFGACASGSVAPTTRECCKNAAAYELWVPNGNGGQYYTHDCDSVVRNGLCDSTGGNLNNPAQKDLKPKDACCDCKASRFADAPAPGPATPPAPGPATPPAPGPATPPAPGPATPPAPAPGAACQDNASFADKDGDTCSSYQQAWCADAPTYANSAGVSAATECCICKSSVTPPATPPAPAPVPAPAPGAACQDNASFADKDGDKCSSYQQAWCADAAAFANSAGVSAATECCICKT